MMIINSIAKNNKQFAYIKWDYTDAYKIDKNDVKVYYRDGKDKYYAVNDIGVYDVKILEVKTIV